ncbi:MAG TPA: hypothetical protein VEX86_22095 [Longimicrobium sp.]|nr:hypothetical protein [Longimicrobium sp.]
MGSSDLWDAAVYRADRQCLDPARFNASDARTREEFLRLAHR